MTTEIGRPPSIGIVGHSEDIHKCGDSAAGLLYRATAQCTRADCRHRLAGAGYALQSAGQVPISRLMGSDRVCSRLTGKPGVLHGNRKRLVGKESDRVRLSMKQPVNAFARLRSFRIRPVRVFARENARPSTAWLSQQLVSRNAILSAPLAEHPRANGATSVH